MPKKKNDFQYIIVGSGVAGSTVAKGLLEHDRNTEILILEAGPVVEARNRRYWWDYVVQANGRESKAYDFATDQPGEGKSIGKTDFLVEGSRLMLYGGSTVHWGGWSLRFKPEDFRLKTNSGEGGDWPISYQDLETYYNRAEEFLSVCGDIDESWHKETRPDFDFPRPPFDWTAADGEMIDAWKHHGIEPGKMPVARYRKCLTTGTCKYCPLGSRFSGQIVLDELQDDTRNMNLEVRSSSVATRVIVDSRTKVRGVEYIDLTKGKKQVITADKVIVCTGTYESPKLLMLSKSRYWKNGIGNDQDMLGRNIVTHSILRVRGRLNHNRERWFQEYDFPTLMSRTYDTPKEQVESNKIFLFKNRALPNIDLAGLMIAGKSRAQIDEELAGSRQQELQAFMEEKSRPENRLILAPGKNRFGLPKMKIDFTRPERTQKNGEAWLDKMEQIVLDMGYAIENKEILKPGGHHATGTCRMGTCPEDGVTDKDLKVFDTDNLYVCSNAVFPSGSAVNPTLTLTALAMRLAEHLTK